MEEEAKEYTDPESEEYREFHRLCAQADLDGVQNADLVLLINSQKSEGKAVEQGIAIALMRMIIAVGKLGEHSKNVFHYLDNYLWVDTIDEAIEEIGGEVNG